MTRPEGERIASFTTGGGGYGSPAERDPEMVRRDVCEGYISVERAREVYGVYVDDAGKLDAAQTVALRAEMAQ